MTSANDCQDIPLFDVPSTATNVDQVIQVFEHWAKTVKNGSRGPKPVLSPERRRKIRQALDLYGYETCIQAIDGVLKSDFHMGRNGRGKKYDDISLILRDAKHIEMFAELALTKDAMTTFLESE